MEIRVDVKGVSCHGSAPERGDNAIYKMAEILMDVKNLNTNDAEDSTEIKGLVKMLDEKFNPNFKEAQFLGRGTITTSEIFFTSPSHCAVADSCAISLDQCMTSGETWESCFRRNCQLPAAKKYNAEVTMYKNMKNQVGLDFHTLKIATSLHGLSLKIMPLLRQWKNRTKECMEQQEVVLLVQIQ